MARKLFRAILPLIILFLLVGINTSCTYFSSIVGKWQISPSQDTIEFTRTGKVIIEANNYVITGTWSSVSSDVINVNLEGDAGDVFGMMGATSWKYTVSGDKLTLEAGGGTAVLDRIGGSDTQAIQTTALASASSIKITYPKGGEIWHVGDTVTIKWTSSNLPKTTELNIFIVINGGIGKIITNTSTILNTGSYKWTIPQSISGISIIGTNDSIYVDTINVSDDIYSDFTSNHFTIEN